MAIRTLAGWQPSVFLLNSRTPLVIETCFLQSRHPFIQSYRASLPSSLRSVLLIRLSLFSQDTFTGSWYGHNKSLMLSFSRAPDNRQTLASTPSLLSFSALCFSEDLYWLNMQTSMLRLARSVRKHSFVAENVLLWYRNMNLFPICPE